MIGARVAIVGGGPVGLYLALVLAREGLHPRVFERSGPGGHQGSRSIGVHPPSIELFDEIGIADAFLARAVRVRRGLALGEHGVLGDVSFEACPGPHRYVATLEQHRTEQLLRETLRERVPDALTTDVEVVHVRTERDRATVTFSHGGDSIAEASFAAVLGADGRRSVVRRAMGVSFDGATYEGDYAMADGPDGTALGEAAAVLLTRGGLVESFPLPGRRRRWVVRRDAEDARSMPSREELARLVASRSARHERPFAIDPSSLDGLSAFRAERRVASRLSVGRVALVGDAAHVVSPIGGQGMNLGWMGARSVARTLGDALREGRDPTEALARDAARRRALAKVVARRAEMNMWLGRPTPATGLRERLTRELLGWPFASVLARAFTMRGLALGV